MYPYERSLVNKMKDLPFALIGVNSDRDREVAKKAVKREGLNWRSFWNGPKGPRGPISTRWNVEGWPTIYLFDHRGVIRYKNVHGEALDRAINSLMAGAKAEKQAKPPRTEKSPPRERGNR